MSYSKRILATLLLAMATITTALAKDGLPVSVDCAKVSEGNAHVVVTFHKPAKSVTVTVSGTGSVELQKVVRSSASIEADGKVVIDTGYTPGTGQGGLGITVKADFGRGLQSQASSFQLIKPAEETVQARSSGNSKVKVSHGKTTVKP